MEELLHCRDKRPHVASGVGVTDIAPEPVVAEHSLRHWKDAFPVQLIGIHADRPPCLRRAALLDPPDVLLLLLRTVTGSEGHQLDRHPLELEPLASPHAICPAGQCARDAETPSLTCPFENERRLTLVSGY